MFRRVYTFRITPDLKRPPTNALNETQAYIELPKPGPTRHYLYEFHGFHGLVVARSRAEAAVEAVKLLQTAEVPNVREATIEDVQTIRLHGLPVPQLPLEDPDK